VAVLLIEDHARLARDVKRYLELEGYAVEVVGDGLAGLERAVQEPWSLVLLDLSLPGLDGLEVCRRLREAGVEVPVLMLTARGERSDVVTGLDSGADDYLAKPFGLDELVARMRALSRRTGATRSPTIEMGDIRIDTNAHSVTRKGRPVHLAPREYGLLEFLARNRGIVQDRSTIIDLVWGEPETLLFSQTVDVHVAYLRRKLGKSVIRTVPGAGYVVPDE
jgi:DNA-binding response OmpR family regulator